MRYTINQLEYETLSKSAVLLLSGNAETAFLCAEISDKLKSWQQGDLWVCSTLAEFEQRARLPAFLGRWWYTGSADRLSADDTRAFNKLLKTPLEFGTAILTGVDFTKYKNLTRGLRSSQYGHEISTSFPNRRYLTDYIMRGVILRGSKISYGAAEAFVWRIGENYSTYEYYLDRLVAELPSGCKEVSAKHVAETLKGVTGASFDDFLKYLMRPLSVAGAELKRSNKMFKTYACMVDDGAAKTLRKLHYKAAQYLEIRRLINEGFLPSGIEFTVDALSKMIGELPESMTDTDGRRIYKKGEAFTRWDMLQWSDMKLKREIEIASQVPLADWYTVVILSARRCNSDEEAERVFFDILTRSRQTTADFI